MAVRSERARMSAAPRGVVARLATETKQAFKTTEFWAMVAIVAGILIASWVIDGSESGDAFPAVLLPRAERNLVRFSRSGIPDGRGVGLLAL